VCWKIILIWLNRPGNQFKFCAVLAAYDQQMKLTESEEQIEMALSAMVTPPKHHSVCFINAKLFAGLYC
jgi:hypothetical protein